MGILHWAMLLASTAAAADPRTSETHRNSSPSTDTRATARVDDPSFDWPQFRGPDGQGHAGAADLPLRWSEHDNVAWKSRIPGRGWSSPVIAGEQIWVTTSLNDGRSLRAVCLDRTTGRIEQTVEVFRLARPGRIHGKNSHASPTPVIDGDRVFVHFGAHGTACLTRDGEIVWKTEIPYYHHHGPAASPVRVGNLLIVACDGFIEPFYDMQRQPEVEAAQFVVGLDAASGKRRWTRPRNGRHAYCTPLAIHVEETLQLISPGGNRVVAYDPETGREVWWCRYDGYSVIPRPVFAGGLVIVCTGYDDPEALAIRPGGRGDVTDTHVVWRLKRGAPLSPSPLIVGKELYLVDDSGIATCLDLQTGRPHWRKRLVGNFSASPVHASGRIYFQNENGVGQVIAASKEFRKLATNRLRGRTLASPAVSGNALFIRTETHLYRLQNSN